MEFEEFAALLANFARASNVKADDVLFGSGLDIASIAFLEFIMELEDRLNREIDVDSLDGGVKTVRQLYDRLFAE